MKTRQRRAARSRAVARSLELSIAAPLVIASRTARMLEAGLAPTRADRREMHRMVSEKMEAFLASQVAMALRMHELWLDAWMRTLQSWWIPRASFIDARAAMRDVERAWHDVLDRGIAPIHRTAMANARRLNRTRRR